MSDFSCSISGLAARGGAAFCAAAILALMAVSAPAAQPELPLNWPVAPLTKSQIDAVRQCDIPTLFKARYPESVKEDGLISAYEVRSDCDRAVLALAFAARTPQGGSISEAAKVAYGQTITGNAGFALATPLFFAYVDEVPLVKAPPFATLEVTDVQIRYKWDGLGAPVNYSAEIHQANAAPAIRVTPEGAATGAKADKKVFQDLGSALNDLVPVQTAFRLSPCTDNSPDWSIVVTYSDKTTVQWKTDSNLISFGGPWFAVIGDRTYIQVSSALPEALVAIVKEMKIPLGQPAGMTCGGPTPIFEKAYP